MQNQGRAAIEMSVCQAGRAAGWQIQHREGLVCEVSGYE